MMARMSARPPTKSKSHRKSSAGSAARLRALEHRVAALTQEVERHAVVEQALRESEERFAAAVDAAQVGTWRIDLRTGEDRWDASLNRIAGFPAVPTTRHASDSYTILHPDDRALAIEAWLRFVTEGEPYGVDLRIVRPSGDVVWVRDQGQLVRGADGVPLYATGAVVDITRRKQAEMALRESEEQFRMLADLIPQLTWMARPDGWIFWFNRRWYEYTGTTPEETVGWGWQSVHDPAELPRILAGWRASLDSGQPFEMVFPLRGADGVFRPFLTQAAPLRDSAGRIARWFGTHTDITVQREAEAELRRMTETLEAGVAKRTAELRQANLALIEHISERARTEEVLKASEERHRNLYNRTPMALHSVDAQARLIDVNDHWLQLFGRAREDVLGRSPPEFMTPESAQLYREQAWPDMLASDEAVRTFEYRFVKSSGEIFEGRLSSRGERDREGRFVRTWAVIVDITAQKQAQEQLKQVQKLEAIGQLTAGVAHDFNNLLTGILGNLELAESRTGDEGIRRLIQNAARSAIRGARLNEQLLAFSRQQKLLPKAVDMNAIVSSMGSLLRSTIGSTIHIETVLRPDLWPALVDPNQIELVILNLAINARDAMQIGGNLAIETRNASFAAPKRTEDPPKGDYVVLSVADSGTGMSEEVRAKASEPFFTTKGPGKGSGLGLSMVFGVARQSGGGMRIDSRLGEGTKVEVYLPRASEAAAVFLDDDRVGAAPAAGLRVMHEEVVLLVDDDSDVRDVAATMLATLGYQVTEARSGGEALEILQRSDQRIDIMLVDFAMPGMNGVETAQRAATIRPDLPILLATGYADAAGLSGEAGRGRILRKPFRQVDLGAKIADALAARSPSRGPDGIALT
jgi:PAS domain S-box-containing protein